MPKHAPPDGARPHSVLPPTLIASQKPALMRRLLLAALLLAAAPAAQAAEGGGWFYDLLSPVTRVSRWVGGLFSSDERFVGNELEHFRRTVDTDLSGFDSLVRQAGFRIHTVSIKADLVPQTRLTVEFVRRLNEPDKAALVARITDPSGNVGTIERSVIMTLLNAAESPYAVRADGFRLAEVVIEVDVVPNVTFVITRAP